MESLDIGMASELGLARARLPGVVFLSSPVGPERFVYWELPDEGTIDALVDGIHEITDAIASADRGEQGMFDAIIETKPGEATYESINF